jgi:guanylate cyclase
VDFTPLTASLEPTEVVEILEEVFDCFDLLVEKYDLEKIKTIGDCYMAAAGVPRPRPDHAEALAGLAVDMRDAVAGRLFHGHRLTFRIGINSGTVVAGVIGRKKFIYDLWGDAVNLASRMESHGTAGSVQVTAATAALIADAFECVPRGRIAVKGSGELDVWHVVGRRNRAGGDAEMAAAAAT